MKKKMKILHQEWIFLQLKLWNSSFLIDFLTFISFWALISCNWYGFCVPRDPFGLYNMCTTNPQTPFICWTMAYIYETIFRSNFLFKLVSKKSLRKRKENNSHFQLKSFSYAILVHYLLIFTIKSSSSEIINNWSFKSLQFSSQIF